jgi:LacI family transcriptional regulator
MNNTKEVTIYDVAKSLGLSPSTVSRGLKDNPHINKNTVKRIKTAANEMGYQRNKFASNLRLKHTNTIGVVIPRLDSYFMATVISGMEKVTNQHGYGLIISQSQESEKQEIACVSTLFNSRVDGLIVSLASDSKSTEHFDLILKKNIPVVFFDRVSECNGCISIAIDNYKAGYEATSHLVSQGCRRIVHVGGNLLRNVYNDRFRGYMQALADNHIKFDQKMVFIGDMKSDSMSEIVRTILKMKPLPQGIFTSNDTSAVTLIVELKKAGINIPEDIAIVGFNNEPISQIVQPNLSTVDYPARQIGEFAATSLINILKNYHSDNLSSIILKHNLIIRQSSLKKNADF